MTPKAQAFMQEFKSRFTPPRDWGATAQDDGTSTLPLWESWIDRERTSPDLVTRILDTFHAQDKRPTLSDVKRAYNISAGRGATAASLPPDEVCEYCDSTGMLNVACAAIEGRNFVITEPGPYLYVFENSSPCKCSAGRRVNNRIYRYPPHLIDRCFKARRTPSQIADLGSASRALADEQPARDDERTLSVDSERDGAFESATEMEY